MGREFAIILSLFILIYSDSCLSFVRKCDNESNDSVNGCDDSADDRTVDAIDASDGCRGGPNTSRDRHCYAECLSRGLVLNATKGWFGTHGSQHLTAGSPHYCLWILTTHPNLDASVVYAKANTRSNARQTATASPPPISLTIERDMRVECPDANIQVFDGVPEFVASGAHSKKLGFYCGTDLKQDIHLVATSGFLTVFFERHDPHQGFNASYTRLDCQFCPAFKSRECVDNQCVCADNKIGSNCDVNICPNNCSAAENQGTCDAINGRCVCMPLYGEEDCSQYMSAPTNRLIWSTLFNCEATKPFLPTLSMYLPRMGHTLESTESSLWLFGGYSSIRGQLGDMFRFNLISSRWEEISSNGKPDKDSPRSGQPQARHFHATAISGHWIYLYGGLSQVHGVLADFWRFHTSDMSWNKLETIEELPPLAAHTLTATDNKLILIGGYSPEYGFLEKTFEYNIIEDKWRVLNTSGVRPVGLYGHSAVYHSQSNTIYVFGGVVYDMDKTSISGDLYGFDVNNSVWYRLPADEQINPIDSRPESRYFHSSLSTELYMIIIGGRSNDSNAIVNSIYTYIYRCNKWISLQMNSIPVSGQPPDPAVALSATIQDYNLYIFGGTNGQTNGNLYRLSLPKDLCQLFSHSRLGCLRHIGCSYCSVYENGLNKTFCYSQDLSIPQSCYNPKGASEVAQGTSCGYELLERRSCYQYKTCIDCVAIWPTYGSSKQVCQWCSNCQSGRCIPIGASCEREPHCTLQPRVITSGQLCPLRSCLASDCQKCGSIGGCMWTRQVLRSELGRTLNVKPIFDWTCVQNIPQDVTSILVESMPPLSCPARCSRFTNCSTCLESAGGEGGHHSCSWAQNINQCISPSFVPLRCETGLCGSLVLSGSTSQCPFTCQQLTQSAHCLSRPHCGWCAFNGSAVDGRGICMEGQLFGPIGGSCKAGQVGVFGQPLSALESKWFAQSEGPPQWAYLQRPKENECLNGHNTCDERHEECIDLEDGFTCRCKPGYVIDGNQCKATCHQGCVFGTCVAPDVCQCNFGYVGSNCSLACECNGHSNCAGINRLSDCLECQNHTQGSQCQECKPYYVGNPINAGKCVSCRTYCNNHSDVCFDRKIYDNFNSTGILHEFNTQEDTERLAGRPLVRGSTAAICVNCKHNTKGTECESCIDGYFQNNAERIGDGCRRCHCNGHSDTCNKVTGEDCQCDNNTETDRQCSHNSSKTSLTPCWQMQCSKCKEYFLGVPTNGHQCYRHMFLDKDYCFDPKTQEECIRKPSGLSVGRTVFFAVQPRYMNVDIRIFVDVTKGALDFFLSAKEDTFVVEVNKTNGIHWIWLDKKYTSQNTYGNSFDDLDSLSLRDVMNSNSSSRVSSTKPQTSGPALKLRHSSANDLIYYLTITDPNEFLVIRNLRNRLVITIPQEVHDLRSTRFYMILKAIQSQYESGANGSDDNSYGNIFFRQDQSRIDLFVFFSVFFSCFFLFLCVCVMVWKVKQAFDMRRARRLHVAEMKHMASRPFATILLHMDGSSATDDVEFALSSPSHLLKEGNPRKCRAFRFRGSISSLKDSPKAQVHPEPFDKYTIRPVAVEPTADGVSAVVTTLVHLPGGKSAPNRMCLASTLVSLRNSHHILNANASHGSGNNMGKAGVGAGVWRTAIRRRPHFAF
ncbi:unnamed protein product [Medioppia subpectinata]|uniref:Multiple epidermal growth factor-like domains protein 8 n=1 Tax=Medioppia subpectinata TaxID=1979941 RepID=A0A7R9KB38_9ACAR|nr:unnamed protein product [Medioppia subpectinata]CAG2100157.1 unnamed protein product [Medioppia subpectinata]